MAEVVLRGTKYETSGHLDAFTQLHLARKLGPALPILEGLMSPDNREKDKGILVVLMLSHVSDADSEYVMRKCLSVVIKRDAEGRGTRIQAPDGSLMYDDITLSDMLELTVAVIEENLGDFFRTALANMARQADQDKP